MKANTSKKRSHSLDRRDAEALLDFYRKRGTAENYYGELINVLAPALSCTTRQKSHYRGKEPSKRYPPGNSFGANDVTLQLAAIAYNFMHAARLMLSPKQRGPQMSLKRLREQVLRAPARLLISGRYITLIIGQGYRKLCLQICRRDSKLKRLPQALPG